MADSWRFQAFRAILWLLLYVGPNTREPVWYSKINDIIRSSRCPT